MGSDPSASWEEIVDRVTIKSNYYNLGEAEMGWRNIFSFLTELHDNLKKLKTNTESWRGGAADGFRDRIDDYAKNIDSLVKDHERIATGLHQCADDLQTAVNTIPIPTWMMGKLEDEQAAYQMGSQVPGNPPGSFGHFYLKHVMGDAYSKIWGVGSLWKKLEKWLNDNEKVAKDAYAKLQANYGDQTSNIPTGNPVRPQMASDVPSFDPAGFSPGGPGSGSLPGLDTPGMDTSGLDAGAGPDFGDTGLPSTGPGLDPGGFDPSAGTLPGAGGGDLPDLGTGLAGAGGGLGGAGSGLGVPGGGPGGLGGLPPGGGAGLGGLGAGGLGAGAGGLGAGALRGGLGAVPLGGAGAGRGGGARAGGARGGRLPGLGPGVTPPAGMLGGRGAAAAAGRGGSGARPAGAGRGAGFVPGAGAGRGAGHDEDHDSWLQEDEDVWGADGGEPPAVLGA